MRKYSPSKKDITFILKNGIKNGNGCFSVFVAHKEKSSGTRLFITTIGKKIIKKSVDRNLYRRRIKSIFHKNKDIFTDSDVLIMAKKGLPKLIKYSEIEEVLYSLFKSFINNKQ